MELKRILAKDLRAATEQAVALYGADALVISHESVRGMTEVIVAVDLQPSLLADEIDRPTVSNEQPNSQTTKPAAGFDDLLQDELLLRPSPAAPIQPQAQAVMQPEAQAENHREQLRAREIVDLVRQEMAGLRRDLQLSTKMMPLSPGLSGNPVVRQLDRALEADHAPLGLRMLLSDELSTETDLTQALGRLSEILVSAISDRQPMVGPLLGRHVLMGPSGSGKTTMLTRLVQEAVEAYGHHKVAVVSWNDHRPGAWNQIQMACAKLGVEAYRCQDPLMLPTVLEEIGQQASIYIDTPGISIGPNRQLITELAPEAALHLVLPADVAPHQAERLLRGHPWQSLMLTKLDEAHHAWGSIQALSHVPSLLYHLAGCGHAPQAVMPMSARLLAQFAIEQLKAHGLAEVQDQPVYTGGADLAARMQSMQAEPSAAAWAIAQQAVASR